MKKLLFLAFILMLPSWALAQTEETLTITASDGLEIVGDFYQPESDEPVPAVLLLHMLDNRRQSWDPLIPALVDAQIAVLAVDMRGQGETGGSKDWDLAEQDIQVLLDWLKAQDNISSVSIIGGSIGSNLALRGMANDPEVVTAIALSPGLNYRDVTTEDAVTTIGERPILLVASREDSPSGQDTPALFALTQGDSQLNLYTGRLHGTNMLMARPALIELITTWIKTHNR